MCGKVRIEREKGIALTEKDNVQKGADVGLCEQERVKTTKSKNNPKKHENVEREEEVDLRYM